MKKLVALFTCAIALIATLAFSSCSIMKNLENAVIYPESYSITYEVTTAEGIVKSLTKTVDANGNVYTKKQYRKKCQKLFCKAKRIGVKLKFYPDCFHHKRLDCLWYGGRVASIVVSPEMVIVLCAYGDVIAVLYDENGNILFQVGSY